MVEEARRACRWGPLPQPMPNRGAAHATLALCPSLPPVPSQSSETNPLSHGYVGRLEEGLGLMNSVTAVRSDTWTRVRGFETHQNHQELRAADGVRKKGWSCIRLAKPPTGQSKLIFLSSLDSIKRQKMRAGGEQRQQKKGRLVPVALRKQHKDLRNSSRPLLSWCSA